jgi:adenylate kinase family enzyme
MKKSAVPIKSVLLLGPTGVGKSPLGDAIGRYGLFGRRCHHIDFGAELRDAVSRSDRAAAYSLPEISFIRGVLEDGLLLENEHFALAEKIISLFLSRSGFSPDDILVLNGIPRHEGQARDMESMATVNAVIVLECCAADVFSRIENNTGGDRTERVDDSFELVKKKLDLFRERTSPLIAYYEKRGSSIYRISVTATMTPQEALREISALAAAHPPVSLVAEPPER